VFRLKKKNYGRSEGRLGELQISLSLAADKSSISGLPRAKSFSISSSARFCSSWLIFSFCQLVDRFFDVGGCCAPGAVILALVQVLHDFFAALFCRDDRARAPLCVLCGSAPIRSSDGFVRSAATRLGSHGEITGGRSHRHRAELIYRQGVPVIIHAYGVQEWTIGGPVRSVPSSLRKILDRLSIRVLPAAIVLSSSSWSSSKHVFQYDPDSVFVLSFQ